MSIGAFAIAALRCARSSAGRPTGSGGVRSCIAGRRHHARRAARRTSPRRPCRRSSWCGRCSGIGEAFFFVAALAAISDLAPAERRGEAINLGSLSVYLGLAIGPFLGETLLVVGGFDAVWIAAAAMAVAGDRALPCSSRESAPGVAGATATDRGRADRLSIRPACCRGSCPHRGVGDGRLLRLRAAGRDGRRHGTARAAARAVRDHRRRPADRVRVAARPDGPGRGWRVRADRRRPSGWRSSGSCREPAACYRDRGLRVGIAFMFPALMALAVSRVDETERGSVVGTTSVFLDLSFGVAPAVLGRRGGASGLPAAFLLSAVVAGPVPSCSCGGRARVDAAPGRAAPRPGRGAGRAGVAARTLGHAVDPAGLRGRRRADGPWHRPGPCRGRQDGRPLRAGPRPRRGRPRPDRRQPGPRGRQGPAHRRRIATRRWPGSSRPPTSPTPPTRTSSSRPSSRTSTSSTTLWRAIDRGRPAGAIFATNTSSIAIHRLAEAVDAGAPRSGSSACTSSARSRSCRSSSSSAASDTADDDRRGRSGPRGGARQAGHRLGRPPGVHRQPHPDAVPRRGDARLRAGRRHRRGHRCRRAGRPEPPDGPAGTRRLHRPRRLPRDHARARGRPGRSTCARRGPRGARRGRAPGPEDRPRLLHLPAGRRTREPAA